MTTEIDRLIERLRRKVRLFPAMGGGSIGLDADGKTTSTSYIIDDGYRYANPDGPEAADQLELLKPMLAENHWRCFHCGDVFTDTYVSTDNWQEGRS